MILPHHNRFWFDVCLHTLLSQFPSFVFRSAIVMATLTRAVSMMYNSEIIYRWLIMDSVQGIRCCCFKIAVDPPTHPRTHTNATAVLSQRKGICAKWRHHWCNSILAILVYNPVHCRSNPRLHVFRGRIFTSFGRMISTSWSDITATFNGKIPRPNRLLMWKHPYMQTHFMQA